jgi:radical SAM-linked protein
MRYARLGHQRFVGHLDNSRNLEFLLRRSGLQVVHGAGFNPRMRLHFSPPLPLGVESEAEYLDFELAPANGEDDVRRALESAAAGLEGFQVIELDRLPAGTTRRQLVSTIERCSWNAVVPVDAIPGEGTGPERVERCRERMLAAGASIERKDKRGRPKRVDLRVALHGMTIIGEADGMARLEFDLSLQGPHAERPDRFLRTLLELDDEALARCRIVKAAAVLPEQDRATARS